METPDEVDDRLGYGVSFTARCGGQRGDDEPFRVVLIDLKASAADLHLCQELPT